MKREVMSFEEFKEEVLTFLRRYPLVLVGLVLFLIGLVTNIGVLLLGILLLVVGVIRNLGILRRDQVVDNWSILIGNAQGRKEEILEETKRLVKETKAPALRMQREKLSPGVIRGIVGEKRDFLTITGKGNPRLKPYQIFVTARDYGNNLDVAWYLTFRPSLWRALLSLIPFVNLIPSTTLDLDLFDLQDLTAYTTNVHHCLLDSVEELMLNLDQDPSAIDRKSRGFLGIT